MCMDVVSDKALGTLNTDLRTFVTVCMVGRGDPMGDSPTLAEVLHLRGSKDGGSICGKDGRNAESAAVFPQGFDDIGRVIPGKCEH